MPSSTDREAASALCGWYPGAVYLPGPTLGQFVASTARRSLARAANQLGKTRAGAKKMDNWCLANPGEVFGVLIADLENHYAEVCAKIHDTITRPELDEATHYTDGRGYYIHGKPGIKYRRGTRVLFRSGCGPVQGLEAFSAGAGWVDEVPQRSHYNAFVRGVHGPLWVTFTPIGRDPQWFRRLVEGDPETGEPPSEQWVQYVAELRQEECPWRSAAQVAEMIAKTDPYQRPQRIRAEWEGPTEGRRFTALCTESVVSEDLGPDAWSTVGIDHGEGAGKEFAVLLRWDATRVIVSDCYVNPRATRPGEDAEGIAAMLARRGVPYARVKHWRGDANSAGKAGVGESCNSMLGRALAARFGLPGIVPIAVPRKQPGSVDYGEQVINIALDARELLVHERCVPVLRCLRHYLGQSATDPEKHGVDALRYGLVEVLCHSGRPSTRLYAGGLPDAERGGLGLAYG